MLKINNIFYILPFVIASVCSQALYAMEDYTTVPLNPENVQQPCQALAEAFLPFCIKNIQQFKQFPDTEKQQCVNNFISMINHIQFKYSFHTWENRTDSIFDFLSEMYKQILSALPQNQEALHNFEITYKELLQLDHTDSLATTITALFEQFCDQHNQSQHQKIITCMEENLIAFNADDGEKLAKALLHCFLAQQNDAYKTWDDAYKNTLSIQDLIEITQETGGITIDNQTRCLQALGGDKYPSAHFFATTVGLYGTLSWILFWSLCWLVLYTKTDLGFDISGGAAIPVGFVGAAVVVGVMLCCHHYEYKQGKKYNPYTFC